ncbi:type II secretion system protein GspG [Pirellulaceae bacterium SH467]
MKRRPIRRGRQRSAFTLMEVLLVLIIIVVIAGFGIRALTGTFDQAKKNQAKAMLGILSTSLKEYQIQVGALPSALDALHQQPSDLADPSMWVQKLDKPVPADPWNRPYEYKLNGSAFELRSLGPDGQSGTQDDITP